MAAAETHPAGGRLVGGLSVLTRLLGVFTYFLRANRYSFCKDQ